MSQILYNVLEDEGKICKLLVSRSFHVKERDQREVSRILLARIIVAQRTCRAIVLLNKLLV